jgi:hypothetical protein|tara:strand:- start:861 stop:1160 length:300 start_codon:yes stop_codon:yes gene_type:complete
VSLILSHKDYRYRMDLKKILLERNLKIEDCVQSTDSIMQRVAIDILSGKHIDEIQVAVISSIMNIADAYKCKKFSILLLQSALTQLESEDFIESGNKLH